MSSILLNEKLIERNGIETVLEKYSYDYHNKCYDFTNVPTISIDPPNTKLYDDALSIYKLDYNHYVAGIHVADVVLLGYTKDWLFEDTSNNSELRLGSLLETEVRNSISLFVEVQKGKIKCYKILKGKIKIDKNLHYYERKIIEKIDDNIVDTYSSLKDLSCGLLNCRKLASDSELIALYMKIYNSVVSRMFIDKDYPLVFLNFNNYKKYYSHINQGYLDYSSYCRASSPLVERASRITQILIYEFLFGNPTTDDINFWSFKTKILAKELNRKLLTNTK